MSLKAKIEAVIYASEEPVTLAQLAGLLGQEAQAELDHLDSAQQTLALDPEAQSAAQPEAQADVQPDAQTDMQADAQPDAQSDASAQASAPEDEDAPESPAAEAEPEAESATEPAAEPEPEPEPEPMDPPPAEEPEPTESSPIPEHPAPEASAETITETTQTAEPKPESKQDEKARERRLRDYFRSILDELIADYATDSNDRGLEIREVAGGFRLSTKPQYHDAVRGFVKSLKPPLKLSLQALETLAVVAYKQPVTAPEISEIRGVDSGGVLGSLMARKLITTAGRKQVIGRPILYKTTRDFLLRFGLKDINELPSIEEFEKMAGELAEAFAEPVQEEIPMPEHAEPESEPSPVSEFESASESPAELQAESELAAELEPEANTVEPQADGDETPVDAPAEPSAETEAEEDEAAAEPTWETESEPEAHTEPTEAPAEAPAEHAESDLTEPIDQAHSSPLRADQDEPSDNPAEEILTDGRISGLPPGYDDADNDAAASDEAGKSDVAIGTLEGIEARSESSSEAPDEHPKEAAYTGEETR